MVTEICRFKKLWNLYYFYSVKDYFDHIVSTSAHGLMELMDSIVLSFSFYYVLFLSMCCSLTPQLAHRDK